MGGFDDTGVARYNGWYFDTDYHVQVVEEKNKRLRGRDEER